ncbi:MAG: TonB-dependent receptor, partial [Verrucomicrobiota bacterium]
PARTSAPHAASGGGGGRGGGRPRPAPPPPPPAPPPVPPPPLAPAPSPQPGARESESLRVTLHGPDWDWLESRWTFGGGETFFEFPGGLTYEEFRRNPRMGRGTDFAEIESWEGRQLLEVELGEWELGSVLSWREEERMLVFGDFFYDQSLESWDGEWVVRREGEKFDVEAGVRWRRESLRTVRESRTGVFLQDAELVRMSGAVFAIGEWDLGGGFAFRQGVSAEGSELEAESVGRVRDDNYDESDRVGEWAAETALEWKGEGLRSWVRYERVYRFPLLDEIAGYQGAILPVAFNRDLGPERGHGMEWGFEGDWGEWEVGGTVFGTWLEGEIGFDGALNVNLAETERFGGEVWVDWERDWLRAGLRYGWTEARFRDGVNEGKDLPLVPQHALTGHVEAEVLEGLKLRGGGGFWSDSFQADDFENVRREIPERVVFNLGLSWALREDWTVFARVSNVLDRASARYAAEGLFYPAAGRQWVLGARMEF